MSYDNAQFRGAPDSAWIAMVAARLARVETALDECDALAERVHVNDPAMGAAYGRVAQTVRAALNAPPALPGKDG